MKIYILNQNNTLLQNHDGLEILMLFSQLSRWGKIKNPRAGRVLGLDLVDLGYIN